MSTNSMDQTILIVDDDDLNISILEEILSEHYPLVVARDGVDACEKFKEHLPGLILMDIMMPRKNGYDACEAIKQSEMGEMAHVILISAKASTEERLRGYNAGADDYLVKPFDEDELLAKVRVQLRLRQALVDLAEARARTAVDNDKLAELVTAKTAELVETRDLVVFSLAKLADSRDPETGEHLDRMRAYCRVLAEQLSKHGPYTDVVDDEFVRQIYLSSPLHDIGKVGIPDAILLKPGRLTDREFEMMKEHAAIGAEALGEVAGHGHCGGFLKMAVEIAHFHHERFNGTGYPKGLSGQDIPLAARIVAVADVFDALTSVRVYKKAFSAEVARSMIENESGEHFDPAIVEAFTEVFDQFVAIRTEFSTEDGSVESAA